MSIRSTIGFKLILSVSLLVITMAVVLSSFFVYNQKTIIENNLHKQGTSLAKNLAYNSEYGLLLKNKEMLNKLTQGVLKNDDIIFVAVYDASSNIITYSASSTLWVNFLKGIRVSQSLINKYSYKGNGIYDIIVPVYTIKRVNQGEELIFDSPVLKPEKERIGSVRVGVSLKNKEKTVRIIQGIAFALSFFVIICGFIWTVLLSRSITRPIKQLVKVTKAVAEGNLYCFANKNTRNDEVGELTSAFSTMTGKLAESDKQIEEYMHTLEQRVEERTVELKEANEKLKKLDELKSNFLSVAAHELKTPLTSIKAFSELLLDDPDTNVNVRNDFLTIIKEEIERLTRLINDILDLSKIEAGKTIWHMKDISMIHVVSSAIESMKGYISQQGILLKLDIPAHLSDITADHDKLVQVVMNLLNNALKFVNHEGRIGIKICETVLPQAEIITAISDTGHGIPPEKLGSIFERFCQVENIPTEVKGTGLGLTICKEIIERLGGRIWVESEIGVGTTFFFSLPVKGANILQGGGGG